MSGSAPSGGGAAPNSDESHGTDAPKRRRGPDLSQLRPPPSVGHSRPSPALDPEATAKPTPDANPTPPTESAVLVLPGQFSPSVQNHPNRADGPGKPQIALDLQAKEAAVPEEAARKASSDDDDESATSSVGPGRIRNPKLGPDNKVRVPLTMPGAVVRRFREEARRRGLTHAELLLEAFDHQHDRLGVWFPAPAPRTSGLPARRMGIRRGLADPTTMDVRVYAIEYAVLDQASRGHNWVSLSEMLTRVLEEELGLRPTPHRQTT